MKKKMVYFLIFVVMFFNMKNVLAVSLTSRVKVIHDKTNLRPNPGTQGKAIDSLDLYDYYEMVSDTLYDDTNNHKGCNGGWYNITYYTGVSGYVCSDDVEIIKSYSDDTIAPSNDCETQMSNAGFPSSYWGGLCKLKSDHPNWNFQAVNTNLDWSYAVLRESACGLNYISSRILDKSFIDTSCAETSPGGFVAPSQKALAYYLDPRNFFTEKYVFQFLDQSYDERVKDMYGNSVTSIISSANFYKYHSSLGRDLSPIIVNAGQLTGASPIFLAVRINQELGSGDSLYNLYSGVYMGNDNQYYGYYNFYNFNVTDSCVANSGTAYCGLNYAKNNNWNSVESAIQGGASLISTYYINAGQYTGYLQKYNLVPTKEDQRFGHQYMSNVATAMNESKTSYRAYNGNGILDIGLVFKIPVFSNMSATIENSNSGAVDDGNNNNPAPSTIPIHTIVTSSGFRYSAGYISNIAPGSDVATLKGTIESVGGNSTVLVMNQNGEVVTSGNVGTGFKVSINNQSTTEVLEVVIKGDTSGDGVINALDLLQVQKNILGTYSLTGAYLQAGDTSSDGSINALDLLQVQKNILGTYTIVQ